MSIPHVPVLRDEVIHGLAIAPGEIHVDGTFGAGGYTRALLASGAMVYALDRDPDAIAEGSGLVTSSDGRLILLPGLFSRMDKLLAEQGVDAVDGVTLDIGVSSMQLDRADRGFSFQQDGPLDMRMGQDGETAADFLNMAEEEAIADVLYHFGDEPRSRRVARAIVAARPLTRTSELAHVVRRALGYKAHDKKDPATRTFQAIRIHLNRELGELEDGLEAAERVLKPGGRLAIVTFHSLEDRMVKRFLRDRSGGAPQGSRHSPDVSGTGPAPSFERVAKPVRPSAQELERNPRARSATLRVATRTANAAGGMR
ncbi:16S rRNA (cytosine(1402)-N(4))-methyltransferase RsmH [Sphingobium boeckii]|uniref:Ribosomal RNA small subunit methyltransferase H n=1 Tax=Sphingobium boeckii TaxID=1082345 RepID=A0A7W9AI76_9SPHN|nr:16S rRNA (cytosine(1402)-N(4))-methyltransferase RsmH [Sphingobium boeckii]MBB5686085.1 16S rRNA (cytosine1402-N4)-methyltransferase [Sphingobium boeckii]